MGDEPRIWLVALSGEKTDAKGRTIGAFVCLVEGEDETVATAEAREAFRHTAPEGWEWSGGGVRIEDAALIKGIALIRSHHKPVLFGNPEKAEPSPKALLDALDDVDIGDTGEDNGR